MCFFLICSQPQLFVPFLNTVTSFIAFFPIVIFILGALNIFTSLSTPAASSNGFIDEYWMYLPNCSGATLLISMIPSPIPFPIFLIMSSENWLLNLLTKSSPYFLIISERPFSSSTDQSVQEILGITSTLVVKDEVPKHAFKNFFPYFDLTRISAVSSSYLTATSFTFSLNFSKSEMSSK